MKAFLSQKSIQNLFHSRIKAMKAFLSQTSIQNLFHSRIKAMISSLQNKIALCAHDPPWLLLPPLNSCKASLDSK